MSNDFTGRGAFPSKNLIKDFGVLSGSSTAVGNYTPSAPAYTPPAPLPPTTGLGSTGGGYVLLLTAPFDAGNYLTLQQTYGFGNVAYVGGSYWVRIS